MKKFTFAVILLWIATLSLAFAQNTEKEMRKEIREKAIRQARKEARKYKKEGFEVTPGSLGMDKMLERTWYKLLAEDENGQLDNLVADGNSVAETRTAAEMAAMEMAKLALAGQLESMITAMVKGNIGNAQLNNEEAASVTKVLTASKNYIAAKLGAIDPVFKIYRNLSNKNVEVNVKIFYNKKRALEAAKTAVREQMEKEINQMHDKMDKLME